MTDNVRNDLTLYDRHARDWWDADSDFARSLHEVNRLRLSLIHDRLGARLVGMVVIDLGCGGGLLAEPLARAGAHVTGVDLSLPSLMVATAHGRGVDRLSYVRGDARRPPLHDRCAGLVICSDLLEHVVEWRSVLRRAAQLLHPERGQLFITTINRTWRARLLAVECGERLGLIPSGTHDPTMFIRPDELLDTCTKLGLRSNGLIGLAPRLTATVWSRRLRMRRSSSLAVEYAAWFGAMNA